MGVVVVLPAVSLLAYRGQHAGLCLCVSFGKWPAVLSSEPMFSFSLEDFVWSIKGSSKIQSFECGFSVSQ